MHMGQYGHMNLTSGPLTMIDEDGLKRLAIIADIMCTEGNVLKQQVGRVRLFEWLVV